MAGIYIPGIEMPKNEDGCEVIIRIQPNGEVFDAGKIHLGLTAIPVPDHGRLVDADALITTFCEWGTRLERGRKLVITMCEAKQAIVDIIEAAPTIIPADREVQQCES